jgi:hypothetical protein
MTISYIPAVVAVVETVLYTAQLGMLLQLKYRSPANSAPEVDATIPVTQEYPARLCKKA